MSITSVQALGQLTSTMVAAYGYFPDVGNATRVKEELIKLDGGRVKFTSAQADAFLTRSTPMTTFNAGCAPQNVFGFLKTLNMTVLN